MSDLAIEQCACGGLVRASYDHPDVVAARVRQHRATLRHRSWAAGQDFVEPAERPTYNTVVTDLASGLARLVSVAPGSVLAIGRNEHAWGLVDEDGELCEVVIWQELP